MSKISLRMPYLIYLGIACILIGVIIAPVFRDIPDTGGPVADMIDHDMHHGTLEIDAVGAPQVDILVTKDQMDGWNLTLTTDNFTFTPQDVNGANADNTGHAHVYVNDVKIARLYGPYFHIPTLPVGDHVISVSLSANDHSYYLVNGNRIEASTTITQEPMVIDQ